MQINGFLIQLKKAKIASGYLAVTPHAKRKEILRNLARLLRFRKKEIIAANEKDLRNFSGVDPRRERLLLTNSRIEGMAGEIDSLVNQPDPLARKFDSRVRFGLKMYRQAVPLGVIGVIYESRPNVTTDAAAICLKSGNAVILKGGREGKHSCAILVKLIRQALLTAGVSSEAAQMIDPENRGLVKQLITANAYVDLVIPRGSHSLIQFVRANATVPIIETGAGVCHTFVDDSADLQKSARVVYNAKTQRVSVCNALDTLVAHQKIAKQFLLLLAPLLLRKQVEIFADPVSFKILSGNYPAKLLRRARAGDFGREFLSQKISIKVVNDFKEAIAFINHYTSGHTEAILTSTSAHIKLFSQLVDAAVIYSNASTRFTDGAIFGLGSEIGISTQKMHARGPMGPAEMTTYKWIAAGNYSVRPD